MGGSRSNFGSVEKLMSGNWRARYKKDGHWYSAETTFTNKTDARRYLETVRADMTRSAWRAPRRATGTLDDYGTRWIETRPGLKASTRALYEGTWRLHIRPRIGGVRLDQLTPDLVRSWHALLTSDLRTSLTSTTPENGANRASVRDGTATVARAYRLLSTVLATAVVDELIVANPCRLKGAGQVRSAERPTLSASEVEALADQVPPRYSALVLLLAWSGLRIGEAAALERADLGLHEERASVTVRRRVYRVAGRYDVDTPKSRAGIRTVALPPHIVPALRNHMLDFVDDDPHALVFTTSTGGNIKTSYSQMMRRALSRIGRSDVRVHDLRHTGMTFAAESGASLPELKHRLGQSTTRAAEIYLHATVDHGRDVANRMSERLPKAST